jgi:predicted metal-dependent peptidase
MPAPLLPPSEREQLARRWESRVALAEQHARQAGRLSASCARLVRDALRPQLPWRVLLARYMSALGRNDYSYRRPSRREGAALMPSLAAEDIDIVVAIDTSGSLTDADLAEFAAEMNALKGELHGRVTLLACDEALDERGPWRFEAWEPMRMPSDLRGGGGTCFVPVFEWIERERFRTDVLVYFTDAEGEFPEAAPDYPVLWLVKGRAEVPWGERIQLN